MAKDLDFYAMIGVAPNASQPMVDHACATLEASLQEKIASNDEAALQKLATLGRIKQVLGNVETRRQYDTLRTTRGHANDLIIVPAIDTNDPDFEKKLESTVDSLKEQLRKPPERIGGIPAGKTEVQEWQQKMWNMLGDDGADVDDPEPIFRQELQRLMIKYGADNVPAPGAIALDHANEQTFKIALRIVGIALRPHAREVAAYCMGKSRQHNLMKSVLEFAELIGIPQMPLKADMAIFLDWESMEKNPLPYMNATFLNHLRNIGLLVQVSEDQIVLDPFHDTENVEAAMKFLKESISLIRNVDIKQHEAVRQSQVLGKQIIQKLGLKFAEATEENPKAIRSTLVKNDAFEKAFEQHMLALKSIDWDSKEAGIQWILHFAELLDTPNVSASKSYPEILAVYTSHGFVPKLSVVSNQDDIDGLRRAIIEELLQCMTVGDEFIAANPKYLHWYSKA